MPRYGYGPYPLGVDYSTPPHALPAGALADARNVYPMASGLLTGRGGSSKVNGSAATSAIKSVFEFRSGTSTQILCNYGTVIAYYNSGTGALVNSITGLTTGKKCQWVNFAGKAICVNEGADAPQYWAATGSCGDLAGSPPTGKTVAAWGNRLWFGGDATDIAKLTGSKLNDPTDYTGTGASDHFYAYVGDAKDPITGVYGFFDWLLIGKRNMLYKCTGTTITDATQLSIVPVYDHKGDSVGFTSPWAITQVGNDLIFLDGMDIKRLSGIQEYGDVEASSIIPHFRDFLKDTADKDYIQYAEFYHYKQGQQIWVSIPTSATTHYVFVLDYKFFRQTGRYAIFPMYGLEIDSFAGVQSGEIDLLYAGGEDGFIRRMENGDDDSATAVQRYFVQVVSGVSENAPDAYEYRKQFHQLSTCIKPTAATLTMTPSYATDLMDDAQVRTSGNYAALDAETVSGWTGTGVKRKDVRLFGVNGKTLAVKWTHEAVDENFVLHPSSVVYDVKERVEIV